jgi:hypothetical protein
LWEEEQILIARYGENRYIDVDLISAIEGGYADNNPLKWWTKLVCNGVAGVINGPDGKNIMDAFEWKYKHAIHDMIVGSPTYKQKLNK